MLKKLISSMIMLLIAVLFASGAYAADLETGTKSEIDTTHRNEGYISVRATRKTDKRLKVRTVLEHSDGTKSEYTYDLRGDGEFETFGLQSGGGKYTVMVLENVDGTRYSVVQTATVRVKYSKENAPFLVPVQNINYNENMETITKAKELCGAAEGELDKVAAVYTYIVENVKYDYDKAGKVQSGALTVYLPVVDDTLATSKGICFDYSSLMAAMLRSQGIPTKLSMGYVTTNSGAVYHAWNEVFITGVGWVKVRSNIEFDGTDWERMDSTFAAGNAHGANSKLMANDENYKKDKEY